MHFVSCIHLSSSLSLSFPLSLFHCYLVLICLCLSVCLSDSFIFFVFSVQCKFFTQSKVSSLHETLYILPLSSTDLFFSLSLSVFPSLTVSAITLCFSVVYLSFCLISIFSFLFIVFNLTFYVNLC